MYIRFSYSHTVGIWMLRGVVERVCLPAGSTVTHDFAGRRGDSKVAGSLECTNDGLRQRGICSLTTGGVSIITILDGNKSLCRLACRGRPSCLRAAHSTTLADIRPVWKKARRQVCPFVVYLEDNMENPLSIENHDAASSYEQATRETPRQNDTRAVYLYS